MSKTVLITGVSGGIGHATAELFSAEGWFVIGVDYKPENHTAANHYIQADVSVAADVSNTIGQVKQTTGRLDALVNNAAIQICKPILDMSVAEWDSVMAVNVRSAFLFAQNAHPILKESQGSIVNISSVHAIATSANITAYAASKGALTALTRALAIEFAPDQIRVNALLPGAVDTSMLRAGLGRGHLTGNHADQMMQQLARKTVMGRIGRPEEIAQVILFLADRDKSSFVTGQMLVVDGGATIRLSTE